MFKTLHFDILAPFYDFLAKRLLGPPGRHRWRNLLDLPTSGTLLDAGGGTGRIAQTLASEASLVVVTDLSHRMLRQASRKKGLHAIQAMTECLPFPTNSIDRIIVTDALHHFSDQAGAVRELSRVLSRGGRLVIEEPDLRLIWVRLLAWTEKLMLMKSRFLTPEEIQNLLEREGLHVQILRDSRSLAAWIVAVKRN